MTLFGKAILCGLETQNYLGKISLNLVASSWNMIPCFSREFLGLYFRLVNAFFLINILAPNSILVQVNLCQKVLSLHQLTHNRTTPICSLNYKFNTWKLQAQTWGEHVVYRNCFWHSEQFLYTKSYPNGLQKEELLTKIYL